MIVKMGCKYNNKILLPRFLKGLFQTVQRVVSVALLQPIISQNLSFVWLHMAINQKRKERMNGCPGLNTRSLHKYRF